MDVAVERMPAEELESRLVAIAQRLEAEPAGMEVAALIPAAPVSGPVVVACLVERSERRAGSDALNGSGGDGYEEHRRVEYRLVDIEGRGVEDAAALREAASLAAIVESLEDVAGADDVRALADALTAWPERGDVIAVEDEGELRERIGAAVAVLEDVERAMGGARPRFATHEVVDEVVSLLQLLERRWSALEAAANTWSEAAFAGVLGDEGERDAARTTEVRAQVAALWTTLAAARRSVLARAPGEIVSAARDAGAALARDARST